jgi:hypothetical protein
VEKIFLNLFLRRGIITLMPKKQGCGSTDLDPAFFLIADPDFPIFVGHFLALPDPEPDPLFECGSGSSYSN